MKSTSWGGGETRAALYSPSLESREKASALTYLVVHLERDVKLQDDQHELEPGAHLLVGQRNVDGKHNVVGLNLLGHGFIEGADLFALVGTPRHEQFGFLSMFGCVHTLGGQVLNRRGGARSWEGGTNTEWERC